MPHVRHHSPYTPSNQSAERLALWPPAPAGMNPRGSPVVPQQRLVIFLQRLPGGASRTKRDHGTTLVGGSRASDSTSRPCRS